jgi:hypothetical protein
METAAAAPTLVVTGNPTAAGPAVSAIPPVGVSPAQLPDGALPGAGPGLLGRTGFPVKAAAMVGLLLILAGTLLALGVRQLTPSPRAA